VTNHRVGDHNMTKEIYCLGTEKKNGFELGMSIGLVGVGFFVMFLFPGGVYMYGAGYGWAAISVFLVSLVMWESVSFRLMRYKAKIGNVMTIPGYFGGRFHVKRGVLRVVSTCILLFGSIFLSAFVISTAANAFAKMLSLDETLATVGISLIIIGCLFPAGFHSSYKINLIRLLLVGVVLLSGCLLIYGYLGTRGIFTNIMRSWSAGSVSVYINALYMKGKKIELIDYLNLGSFGLVLLGIPGIYTHFMGVGSAKTMNHAKRVATVNRMLQLFLACVFGGLLRAFLFPERFQNLRVSYEGMIETVLRRFIDRGVIGTFFGILFMLAILSVLLSFAESLILHVTTVFYEDVLVSTIWAGRERGNAVMNLKLTMVLSVMLAGFIALMMKPSSYMAGVVVLIIFTAAIGVPLFVSLYWKKMSYAACISGVIFGTVIPIVYMFVPMILEKEKYISLYAAYNVSPLLVSVICDVFIMLFVGIFTKKPEEQICREFDDVRNRIV